MSATIKAARACANTLLFHSLRLQAFRGAVPHLLVVVDRVPCVQQKAVVEGYMQVLRAYQQLGPAYLASRHDDILSTAPLPPQSTAGEAAHAAWEQQPLFIGLKPGEETPCGSAGFAAPLHADSSDAAAAPAPLSYSVLPFQAETFLDDIKRLQRFLRHCGDGQQTPSASRCWRADRFEAEYGALCPLLGPLLSSSGVPVEEAKGEGGTATAAFHGSRCDALYRGPPRELLGCVLVQQNAFQNEMKRYRLRLSLFDLGIRVAEHCHLLIMSSSADRLAKDGDYAAALAHDEVYSYARSCAFRPAQAHTLAKAISDAIDLHSWRREAAAANSSAAGSSATDAPPPFSFSEALHDAELRAIFNAGGLRWGTGADAAAAPAAAAASTADVEAALRLPIGGPGVPLSIVSRDPAKVLTFSGGMEDCLTNTGYYPAAYAEERNDVAQHRARFPVALPDTEEAAAAEGESAGALDAESAVSDAGSSTAGVHGRLKKKEYLAMLKAKGQKPNKRQHDSDDDEDSALGRRSAPAGSCISNSIGGTFPIGEVISESFDLSQLNGQCDVFAYPDVFKQVTMSRPVPFTMTIEKGVVTHISEGAPAEFLDLLSLVRQVEGDCYVRELGIGLNPYVGRSHVVSDVTTFERQWGIHLSLGQRHPLFVKQRARCNADGTVAAGVQVAGPVLKRKAGKYHIDVFIDAAQLVMGDVFAMDFTKGIAIP